MRKGIHLQSELGCIPVPQARLYYITRNSHSFSPRAFRAQVRWDIFFALLQRIPRGSGGGGGSKQLSGYLRQQSNSHQQVQSSQGCRSFGLRRTEHNRQGRNRDICSIIHANSLYSNPFSPPNDPHHSKFLEPPTAQTNHKYQSSLGYAVSCS